jgi:hypothetical protein
LAPATEQRLNICCDAPFRAWIAVRHYLKQRRNEIATVQRKKAVRLITYTFSHSSLPAIMRPLACHVDEGGNCEPNKEKDHN